jgi:hypothetical protein
MELNWEKASAPHLPDVAIIPDRFSSQRAFCRPDPRAAACILLLSLGPGNETNTGFCVILKKRRYTI